MPNLFQIFSCKNHCISHAPDNIYCFYHKILKSGFIPRQGQKYCCNRYVVRCAIWYHLHNLKNVKITHGGVLILVKSLIVIPLNSCKVYSFKLIPVKFAYSNSFKLTLLHWCFSRFLNCRNGTKLCNASHI